MHLCQQQAEVIPSSCGVLRVSTEVHLKIPCSFLYLHALKLFQMQCCLSFNEVNFLFFKDLSHYIKRYISHQLVTQQAQKGS